MSWVKIDDQIGRSRKHIAAGPEASWFWVCAIAHCSASLTDGFIDAKLVSLLGDFRNSSRLAERLVEVGLFDRVECGYRVHDYHDYNRKRDEVLKRRALDTERKRLGAQNSTRIPRGFHADSTRIPSGIHPDSVTIPSGHGTEWRGVERKEGQPAAIDRRASAIEAMWQIWRNIMPSTPLTATPKEYQALCELADTLIASGGGHRRFEDAAKLFASSPSLQGIRGLGMLRAKWAELCAWLDEYPGVPFGDLRTLKQAQEHPSWIDTIPSAEQTRKMNAEGRAIAEENRRRYAEKMAAKSAAQSS